MSNFINPAQKLLQHIDRIADIKRGLRPAPVNVEIDLSNRCSLGCEWCHFGFTHTRGPLAGKREKPRDSLAGGDLMDEGLALTIIDELRANEVRSISWTGGGEPTLHPQFDQIIAYAHQAGIDQGIYTHGGHIDAGRAELLKRCMTWVYVSLDCITREEYQKSKGVDRFEAACAGIRNLVHAKGKATLGVGFLIHADNYQQVPDMIAFGLSLGVDYVQFRPAVHFEMDDPDHAAKATVWIDDAMPMLRKYSNVEGVVMSLDRFEMYRNWQGHGYTTCYWAGMQTVITPDGSLWTCVNKRENAGAWLGNLRDQPFAQLWAEAGGMKEVDGDCRVLCRGHVPNVSLQAMMSDVLHKNFI